MKWLRFMLQGLGCLLMSAQSAHALNLPVQWSKMEQWSWQGQELSQQHFTSTHDALSILRSLHEQVDRDLFVQRLPSAWVVSFEQLQQHYLLMLQTTPSGAFGWLSRFKMTAFSPPIARVFAPFYEHSWQMSALGDSHEYTVLRLSAQQRKTAWSQLKQRLIQFGWQPLSCAAAHWCSWQNSSQHLQVFQDNHSRYWYVLRRTTSRSSP